jgi:hypothetical protein
MYVYHRYTTARTVMEPRMEMEGHKSCVDTLVVFGFGMGMGWIHFLAVWLGVIRN